MAPLAGGVGSAGTPVLVLVTAERALAVPAGGDSPAYLATYPDFTPGTCVCEGGGGCILYKTVMFNIKREL